MTRRARLAVASALLAAPLAVAQAPVEPYKPVPGFGQPPAQPTAKPPTTPGGGGVLPTGGQLPVTTPPAVKAPAVPPATDEKTTKHLQGWEAAMKEVRTYYAKATMTESDPVMKREAKFDVSIWLMTPTLARMDMAKPPAAGKDPGPAEKMIISDSKTIYEYDLGRKTRTRAALGPGGAGNNLLLDLMSGMKAKQVTDRFTVTTAKEDDNFIFLEVKPFYAQDKEEFETLTLVLCGPKFGGRAYIPRMVILKRNDGRTTETWDFPDPKVNPKGIDEKTFNPVDIPRDWKDDLRVLPKAPPPATGTGGVKPPAPTTPRK